MTPPLLAIVRGNRYPFLGGVSANAGDTPLAFTATNRNGRGTSAPSAGAPWCRRGWVFLCWVAVHSACVAASLIPVRRQRPRWPWGRPTRRRSAVPGQGPLQFNLQRETEERTDQDDQAERERALDGLLDRDRQHDVRDDQYLQAQEDRPADILSGALVGGRGALANVDRGLHQGQERTADENRHTGDLEAVDYPLHGGVKVHPASADLTEATV